MEDQAKYEIKVGQHGKGCECSKCQEFLNERGHARTCRCDACQEYWKKQKEENCLNCGKRINTKGLECPLESDARAECVRDFWSKFDPIWNYESSGHENHIKDEMVRGKALKKALEIINGERQDSYGNPEDSFAVIAKYWNAYLIEVQKKILPKHGFDLDDYTLVDLIDGRNVAEMMALFKIARMSGQQTTADNYADAAGYIGIAGDMVSGWEAKNAVEGD